MKFACRTRGNAAPQGKPRVFLTGHPADLPACSEDIFTDILNIQDCAVYYDEESDAPCDKEALLQELEQMQLLVIPVTSRFLYQPNRSRDVEFPFAMERHIPVLPLMQEEGLEADFNRICGDLQMLNKQDPDPTALPYAEKLSKFLASVLVGDELARKVRAAFDAYVFLSYRKKDRRYAQDLMRLIHKNEFCRDIAIWYDEFLVPGENFNEAIADAMKRCSLFTLAVTPNIVEPGNYVMRLEYPEAKKAGKPILPAELIPTDREALKQSFPDLPPCADAGDEGAFSDALLQAVQKLAPGENDDDPEHNFFIGLAYLNGIDVEVDRDRALTLITGSAESGVPEAMEQLVHMYRNGDGAARDYHTAARWQERYADYWRRQYEQSGAREDGERWGTALYVLGSCQEELGNLSAAGQTYEQLLALNQKFLDLYKDAQAQERLADSCDCLGDICGAEGRLDDAKNFYLQSLTLHQKLYDQDKASQTARWGLCGSYDLLGGICEEEDRLEDAGNYYLQSLELRRQLWEETSTVLALRHLTFSYDNLGRICLDEGKLENAAGYYLQHRNLCQKLYEMTETPDCLRSLSISCEGLGNICRQAGKLEEAQTYYLQSLGMFQKLLEDTGTIRARQDVAGIWDKLGHLVSAKGDLTWAKNCYLQNLELRLKLCREIGTLEARRDLSISYECLGDICRDKADLNSAKKYYLQSLGLREKLCEETWTVQARRDLALAHNRLSRIHMSEGNLKEAENCCIHSLAMYQMLYDEHQTVQARQDLAFTCDRLGDILRTEGYPTEAKKHYLQGLELRRQLCGETETIGARRDLAVSLQCLGNVCREEGNLVEANDYYLQCLDPLRQICEETGTIQARRDLLAIYGLLGDICEKEKKPDEAERYYLQSLELARQLYKEEKTRTVLSRRDLATIYTAMGNVRLAQGNKEEARNCYRQSFDLYRALCEDAGNLEDLNFAAIVCFNMGYASEGELQKSMFTHAFQMWDMLCRKCPDVAFYARRRDQAKRALDSADRKKEKTLNHD